LTCSCKLWFCSRSSSFSVCSRFNSSISLFYQLFTTWYSLFSLRILLRWRVTLNRFLTYLSIDKQIAILLYLYIWL
jgi:hypothetical protein